MKKFIFLLPVLILLFSFKSAEEFFTGKIVYQYSFSDYKGTNMDAKLSPVFGKGQIYYIDGKNYKTYTPENQLQLLFNSEGNGFYYFPDGQHAQKMDVSKGNSKIYLISKIPVTEKIAGYDCKAVKIETDEYITVYYYTPEIKTLASSFALHNTGDWNKYLTVTGGALALKYTMTNKKNGVIWTATATEITKQDLTSEDFSLPATAQIKQ